MRASVVFGEKMKMGSSPASAVASRCSPASSGGRSGTMTPRTPADESAFAKRPTPNRKRML
jgi:hypothetical protein